MAGVHKGESQYGRGWQAAGLGRSNLAYWHGRGDSAPEAVEAFLNQAPAFEGGGVRLLDHHDQRMVASVEWRTEKTDFGFPVFYRSNRFHDSMIEFIAGEATAREAMRADLRRETGFSYSA